MSEGGGAPRLPRVRFPIHDEVTLRQAFECIPGTASLDVDFTTERIDRVDFFGADKGGTVAWIARVADHDRLVARAVAGVECGGIEPRSRTALVVLPGDAPPLATDMCRIGSCRPGPPRP